MMAAYGTRYSPYHEVSLSDDNGEIQLQQVATQPLTGRPPSVDSLCLHDDGNFRLLVEPPSDPGINNHPYAGSSVETVAPTSIARRPNGFESTKQKATASIKRKPLRQSSTPVQSTWKARYFKDAWLWEILCIVFSIACIVAVIILASRLQDTWLSKWTFPLQPSTLISILVTGAQSSMMLAVSAAISQLKWLHMRLPKARPLTDLEALESASRGPLGSLSLFYKWKEPSGILSTLIYTASLVTIAALAMGPFAQQIVSIQVNSLEPEKGVNSTIAVSDYYDNNNTSTDLEMFLSATGIITVSSTSGVNDAFDVEPNMQGAFYTGIYNLDESYINFGCPSGNCSWGTFTSLGLCSTCQDVSATTKIDFSPTATGGTYFQTPGGWYLYIEYYGTVVARANSSFFTATLDTLSARLVSLVVVQNGSVVAGQYYTITECAIAWCAKQYSNITVTNGALQDQYLTRELPLWSVEGQDFGGLARGLTTGSNWVFLLTPDSSGKNVSSALSPFDNSAFNVSIYDHFAISQFFANIFNITSASTADYFALAQNVTTTIANISNSMTNRIPSSDSEVVAQGIVWQQLSIIRIQFAWLVLPLVLILFSAILLIVTVLMTRRSRVPVWKSSILPLLYHGIREWDDAEERDIVEGRLEKMHVMDHKGSSKRVRMFTSAEGGTWLTKQLNN